MTFQLARASVAGPVPAMIAFAALALLLGTKTNPAWLVLGGGAVVLASRYLLG